MLRRTAAAFVATVVATVALIVPASAITGGDPVEPNWVRPMAKINVGDDKACSGVLVAPQWVLTVASCFSTGDSDDVRTGAAPAGASVAVGRPDLTASDGNVRGLDWIVPHPEHDVALARMTLGVDTTPWAIASAPAVAGEALAVAGFGRTEDAWVPDELQVAEVSVGEVGDASLTWDGPVTACAGDAGGVLTRVAGTGVEVVGLLTGSTKNDCYEEPVEGDHTGQAVRADILADWAERNMTWYTEQFVTEWQSPDNGNTPDDGIRGGIGGYNLLDPNDQIVAVDYEGTGKLDHLLVYRPGPQKKFWVLKRNANGSFQRVYHNNNEGIGAAPAGTGAVLLGQARDKVIAFDCHRSGKLDCIVVYRPGLEANDGESSSFRVFERDPDGGYRQVIRQRLGRLSSAADRMVALDVEGTGKADDLVFYRPGAGWVTIVSWVYDTQTDSWRLGPNAYVNEGGGIGGFDMRNPRDRMFAFDCHRTGMDDCIVVYRPGLDANDGESSSFRVLERASDGSYRQVFRGRLGRLNSAADRMLAYDYDRSGKNDHLVFYRPGAGWVTILPWFLDSADDTWKTGPAVYSNQSTGIGGYDMRSTHDRMIAYDSRHAGAPTGLLAYRPQSGIAYLLDRRREAGDPAVTVDRPAGDTSIVENFAYPNAAALNQELNIELVSGDGHIVVADCQDADGRSRSDVVKVRTELGVGETDQGVPTVCFDVLGPKGQLSVRIPNIYEIAGDGTYDMRATVENTLADEIRVKTVDADEFEQFGWIDSEVCDFDDPDYPESCEEMLLSLRVAS